MATPDNFVLYDGDCPVCAAYLSIAQLKRLRPDLLILDARQEPALVAELRQAGHEVNDSIIVKLGPQIYANAAATRLIATLGSQNPLARRLALTAIGAAPWSAALYPWLRFTRNRLLRALGRPQIG